MYELMQTITSYTTTHQVNKAFNRKKPKIPYRMHISSSHHPEEPLWV